MLGCYLATGWRNWCVSPEVELNLDERRPNFGRQEERRLSPEKEIMAIRKPPLTSARMSALLCVTYCVSAPVSNPIAVLMVNLGWECGLYYKS